MKNALPALALLGLLSGLARPALALDATDIPSVPGNAIHTEDDDAIHSIALRIVSEPRAADAVAGRILHSSVGAKLSQAGTEAKALDEVRGWVGKHPEEAASLAFGFGKDDTMGNHDFERSLTERVERYFQLSPTRNRGLLGFLDQAATLSKGLAASGGLDDGARREVMKRVFEGRESGEGRAEGRGDGRDSGAPSDAGAPPPPAAEPAYAGDALYDRLSAANPTGYSPQVLAYQSEMNRQRAPGAPKLVETGRLDWATLRYPAYGLRYDVDRLSQSLLFHRAAAQAVALGKARALGFDQLKRPEIQADLDKESGGKDPDPSFARRRLDLEKASAALKAFEQEASPAADASRITPKLLRALAAKRKEAARWITAAAERDWLQILRSYKGVVDPGLKALVERTPAPPELRAAYLARGAALEARLGRALEEGERAAALLEGGAEGGERLMEGTREAVRRLPREIEAYRAAPVRLLKTGASSSQLRSRLDAWILRLMPGSARARSLRKRQEERAAALAAFERMAESRD